MHTDKHKKYAQWNEPSVIKPNPEKCKDCSSKSAYHCPQLSYTTQHGAVLIILPLNLQRSITAQILPVGGEGKKIGHAVPKISVRTDKHTQTDIWPDYNTPLPHRGGIIIQKPTIYEGHPCIFERLRTADLSPHANRSADHPPLITMPPADRQEIKGFVFGPHTAAMPLNLVHYANRT